MGSWDRQLPGGPAQFILQTINFEMNLGHCRARFIASAVNTTFPRNRFDRITIADASPRSAAEFRKAADKMVSMMDQKIDKEFIERMFNKFSVMMTEVKEKIENQQRSFMEWVTRDELVVWKFAAVVGEVQDSALAHAQYEFLMCWRKKSQVARILIRGEQVQDGGHTIRTEAAKIVSDAR
jgi:hypothetical protein